MTKVRFEGGSHDGLRLEDQPCWCGKDSEYCTVLKDERGKIISIKWTCFTHTPGTRYQ